MTSRRMTVKMMACLDDRDFSFYSTSSGDRMVVAKGMRQLIGYTSWNEIQKTCPELLDAGNKCKSVPTSWFMAITANPPAAVK